MLISWAMGGFFLVENPCNSLIALHPRWVWLLDALKKHGELVPWLSKGFIAARVLNFWE